MASQFSLAQIKQALASVEQSGQTKGHYAQLTRIALKDLQQRGQFPGVSFAQVLAQPKLYDQVVLSYWNRLGDFGIPDDLRLRTLYWYKPALFQATGGDISKVPDPTDRNIFQNRAKNYEEIFMKKGESKPIGVEAIQGNVKERKPRSRTDRIDDRVMQIGRQVMRAGFGPFTVSDIERILSNIEPTTLLPGIRKAPQSTATIERTVRSLLTGGGASEKAPMGFMQEMA